MIGVEIRMMNKGLFICFCGIDGSGKSTQAEILKKNLLEYGCGDVIHVHGIKPGKHSNSLKTISTQLKLNFTEVYTPEIRSVSFLIDLWETYNNKIKNERLKSIVICEKYTIDSLAFAPLLGCNERFINDFVNLIPKPDVYIYLDVSPSVAVERLKGRGDYYSNKKHDVNYLINASERYNELINSSIQNVIIIEAESKEELVAEKVKKEIITFIQNSEVNKK